MFPFSAVRHLGQTARRTVYWLGSALTVTLLASCAGKDKDITAPYVSSQTLTSSNAQDSTPLEPGRIATTTISAGEMTNGATYTGSIGTAGQVDSRTFTATAGDYIILSAGETGTPTAAFTPWIRLQGPTGTVLASNYGASAAQVAVKAPATGTYTVLVASGQAAGTGNYLLTLAKTPGALVVTTGDQGGALVNGAIHTGNIYVGDVDAWTFAATAGDYVVVSIGETGTPSATFTPWIRVVGPTGTVVGTNYNAATAEVSVKAPVSGTYRVLVGSGDAAYAGSGDYRLSLNKTGAAVTVTAGDQGGVLTNGAVHTGSIYSGDVDSWTFSGTAGGYAIISMGETGTPSATFTPWIRLVGPTGTVVGTNYNAATAEVSVNLPTTGTYTVLVGSGDAAYAGSGDYQLSLNRTGAAVTVTAGDQGGALTNGAIHTGNIYSGDIDTWTFAATAGDYVVVSMGETGTPSATFTPWIRVVGPTGTIVGTNYNAATAEVSVKAPVSGTYMVFVGSGGAAYAGSGDYRLSLNKTGAAVTVTAGDQGGALTNGLTHTGSIYSGDVDSWTFSGTAGEYAVISVGETGTPSPTFTPWLRVVGPTGTVVGTNYNAATAEVSLNIPISGTLSSWGAVTPRTRGVGTTRSR